MIKKIFLALMFFKTFFSFTSAANEEKIDDNAYVEEHFDIVELKEEKPANPTKDQTAIFGDRSLFFNLRSNTPLPKSFNFRNFTDERLKLTSMHINPDVYPFGLTNTLESFLASTKNLDNYAQISKLTLPKDKTKVAKSSFGFGSNYLINVSNSISAPIDNESDLFLYVSIDSDQKNITYEKPDYTHANKMLFEKRLNNDQNRIQAAGQYQKESDEQTIKLILSASAQEGGLPGFDSKPFPNLRSHLLNAGVLGDFSQKIKKTDFFISTTHNVLEHQTLENKTKDSNFTQTSHELVMGFTPLNLPKSIQIDLAQKLVYEHAYETNESRIGAGLLMNRNFYFKGISKPTLTAKISIMGFAQEGISSNKNLYFTMKPADYYETGIQYNRTDRFASLLEKYGSNKFFAANKDIKGESSHELVFTNELKSEKASLELDGFVTYISDGIFHVPSMPDKIMPKNSGRALKAGVATLLAYQPFNLLAFETKNELLPYTKIFKSKKSLPYSPKLSGIIKFIVGEKDFLALTMQSRYKLSSYADLEEKLKINSYMLFDTLVSYKINDKISLSLLANNIFNDTSAKDQYGMPLGGTLFYGQIELNSL